MLSFLLVLISLENDETNTDKCNVCMFVCVGGEECVSSPPGLLSETVPWPHGWFAAADNF
jgi:hypothetical protein